MSVLHQESLYSATAPAALYVAAVLNDPRTLACHENYSAWDNRPRPLRAVLVEWLGQIADSAAYGETTDDEDGNDPGVTDAVRAVRGTIHDAVSTHLLAPDPTVRAAALGATAALLQSPELASRISGTTQILRRLLAESTDRGERATTILTIGTWGEDTTCWLADRDPAIRACSALSPRCADNTMATQTILRALLDPAAVDSWFREPTVADPWAGDPLPHIEGRLRHVLLSAAIERAADFEELLPRPWPLYRSAATSPSPKTGDRCSPRPSLPAMTKAPNSLRPSTVTWTPSPTATCAGDTPTSSGRGLTASAFPRTGTPLVLQP
ncbi:hypothetical protein OG345_39920 [Streptomyces sp. NBC_01220]|uniref:hypothetical protein n=1 Tax=Streptomyces sp. NBC_01220 TaxID=2903781 RepID=UPI00352F6ECF|nr:hypothetical protein OG345_39920 [Streptomyces sp. NBC_01220]